MQRQLPLDSRVWGLRHKKIIFWSRADRALISPAENRRLFVEMAESTLNGSRRSERVAEVLNVVGVLIVALVMGALIVFAVNTPHAQDSGTGWNPCYNQAQCQPPRN